MKSAVLLAFLFFNPILFSETQVVPPEKKENKYEKLDLFAEVLSYIENSYYQATDREKLITNAIKGMMQSLDPHSMFFDRELFEDLKVSTQGVFGGFGLEVTIKNEFVSVIAPIPDSPAAKAGIKTGDLILFIDNLSTKGMDLSDVAKYLRDKKENKIKLTVQRKGIEKPFILELTRDIIILDSTDFKVFDRYGYIRIKTFQESTHKEFLDDFQKLTKLFDNLPGLIIDLRDNPGGLFEQAVKIADLLLDSGVIVTTIGRDNKVIETRQAAKDDFLGNFPLVLLINSGTASAAEILAGAIQDNKRGLVLGERSYGKGSVQTMIELSDNSGLKLTIANYYTPRGKSISNIGIQPDIEVLTRRTRPVTFSNSERSEDLQLIQAVNTLKSFEILSTHLH